jgi:alpha-tubulin suppressor-like RCC1 family protein
VASPARAVDPPFDDAVQVDGGERHSCGVDTNHKAWCWGDDTYLQLGNGMDPSSSTAVAVLSLVGDSQLSAVRQISAGANHSCAVLFNNEARCWGDNTFGQLGTTGPSIDHAERVVSIAGGGFLTGVQTIGAGEYFTCALLINGQVRCWGANGGGRLGDGTTTQRLRPVVVRGTNGVAPLTGVARLSVGRVHACATLDNGQARCWGVGEHGRLGNGTEADRTHAVVVKNETGSGPLTGVRQVVAGYEHTCARLASRQVRCWGVNSQHQLGIQQPAVHRLLPVVVRSRTGSHPPLSDVASLGSGGDTTCAVLLSHQVRCWGDDGQGELGNGTSTGQVGPVAVRSPAFGIDPPPSAGNLTGITQVSGGLDHLCARRSNGRAYCWGSNTYGQVGFGSNNDPVHRPTSVLRTT